MIGPVHHGNGVMVVVLLSGEPPCTDNEGVGVRVEPPDLGHRVAVTITRVCACACVCVCVCVCVCLCVCA